MKALVLKDYLTFDYCDVPDPVPEPDEVLIQIKACAICGSDIHGCAGGSGRRLPPLIMGHEASGIICKTGAAVTGWKPGDRVTFDSTEYCGSCWFCTHGYHNLCADRKILGVACTEYKKNGAMAEYITVKAHTLYQIPDKVSFEEACLIEPLSVGMHAVRIAGDLSGKNVVIIGAGTIGLMTLLAAKSNGAKHVIVSGHHAYLQKLSLQLGADEIAEDETTLSEQIKHATENRGADVVFDSVGTQASFDTCMKAVRPGGTVVCIGNASRTIQFPLQQCIVEQISVLCSYSSEGEYPLCLDAISEGRIRLDAFTEHTIPLSEGAEAFRRLRNREEGLLKVILTP